MVDQEAALNGLDVKHHWLHTGVTQLLAQRGGVTVDHLVWHHIYIWIGSLALHLKWWKWILRSGLTLSTLATKVEKPRCCIIGIITSCSTVSKVLAKSNLRIKISFWVCWHWCMYSKLQAKQSWMVRERIKPYWLAYKRSKITNCNLSASNSVKSLMSMFSREIGLKSLTVSGLFILATRVMKELLMLSRFTSKLKKASQSL